MRKISGRALALNLELPSDAYAPSAVRRFLEELDIALPRGVLDDLKLGCTELVTNSVRHSGIGSEGTISLRLETSPALVRVEVRDRGRGFEPPAQPLDPQATTGRGLVVIDGLASAWGVSTERGTLVWFELEVGDRSP